MKDFILILSGILIGMGMTTFVMQHKIKRIITECKNLIETLKQSVMQTMQEENDFHVSNVVRLIELVDEYCEMGDLSVDYYDSAELQRLRQHYTSESVVLN